MFRKIKGGSKKILETPFFPGAPTGAIRKSEKYNNKKQIITNEQHKRAKKKSLLTKR